MKTADIQFMHYVWVIGKKCGVFATYRDFDYSNKLQSVV